MKIEQPAHARLQLAIREWMRENLPEAEPLFREPDESRDHYGVAVSDGCVCEPDLVSMHAATAAYNIVIAILDAIDVGGPRGKA